MFRTFASQVPKVTSAASCSASRQLSLESSAHQRKGNRKLEVNLQELTTMQYLDGVTLIDVRQPAELYSQEQIPGSLHIPLGNLRDAFQLDDCAWQSKFNSDKPSKNGQNIIFYARGPIASSAAVEIAHKLGYKKSRHYAGGWEDYCVRNNLPLTKGKMASSGVEDPIQHHYNYHYYNPDLHYM